MARERQEFLNTLQDSYSAYYNIFPAAEDEAPLVFRAEYFSRAEKYWLSKSITVWGNETNEYAFIYAADSFDRETAERCVAAALAEALPKVRPHKEHQYTNVKTVFVADSFTPEALKYLKKRKFEKSYKFSLHGFTMLKIAAVDLQAESAVTNPAGHELADYFKKLFAAGRKKT